MIKKIDIRLKKPKTYGQTKVSHDSTFLAPSIFLFFAWLKIDIIESMVVNAN